MTKKELSRYYHLTISIKDIEEKLLSLRENSISSTRLTGMPHSGKISNPVQQRIELIEKYTEKLENKKLEAMQEMLKIEAYISSIEECDTSLIFSKRYIELKRWDQIAREMHMSERSVFRKHSERMKGERNESSI